jgi:hypothetical protein
LFFLAFLFFQKQSGKPGKGKAFVEQLGTFPSGNGAFSRGNMDGTDGGFGFIDVLAAGAA